MLTAAHCVCDFTDGNHASARFCIAKQKESDLTNQHLPYQGEIDGKMVNSIEDVYNDKFTKVPTNAFNEIVLRVGSKTKNHGGQKPKVRVAFVIYTTLASSGPVKRNSGYDIGMITAYGLMSCPHVVPVELPKRF